MKSLLDPAIASLMTATDWIAPGTTAKLLEGHGLHECQVTGQSVGFVSIKIGGAIRLVRRTTIYLLPQERRRLQEDLQNSINHLATLQDEVALMDDFDPTEQIEDEE
jgi:hypothetical protein